MEMTETTLQKLLRRFQNTSSEEKKNENSFNNFNNMSTVDIRLESIETKLNDLSRKLQYITAYESQARLFRVEERVDRLEKSTENSFPNKVNTFGDKLADRVSGIVGLKEILTVEHRVSKYAWIILFLLGIGATIGFVYQTVSEYLAEPTATKIKLNVSYAYDIPPVGICPDAWMDAEKAHSQGLSLDAFAYSLGYIDTWFGMNVPNRSAARAEFFEFYNSRNYKSLLDYFKSVSIDLKTVHTDEGLANFSAAIQVDPDKATFVGKYFMSYQVCNVYAFKPIDRGLFTTIEASVKFEDKTKDAVAIQPGVWIQFGTSDLNLLSYPISPIYANTLTKSKILIHSRRVVTMEKSNARCAGSQKESAVSCAANCQNNEYKKRIKCQFFKYSFVYKAESPLAYCNFLETLPMSNWTFDQFRTSATSAKITEDCLNQCPPKCDRILYQATLQWQQLLPDPVTLLNVTQNSSLPRKCFAEISLEHNAKYEGETMTLMEVGTYSFTELANNVGGTLGLFVGGTLMTFAQLIVFFVEHCFRNRNVADRQQGQV